MPGAQLRPMGFGEILDVAFTLYRRHFGTFFLTALIPNLPLALFWMYLGSAAGGTPEQMSALGGVASLLVAPYSFLATALVWGALVDGSSRAIRGEPVSLGGGYRRALASILPLIGASILAAILIGLGFVLFVVPGILLSVMFFAVYPAIVVEGEGPLSALGRSREIAEGGWARIFGILFVTWLIVFLPTMALFGGLGFLAALNPAAAEGLTGGALNAGVQAAGVVVGALTTPYMVAALVTLYYDRRVRNEALDLELATEQVSPAG